MSYTARKGLSPMHQRIFHADPERDDFFTKIDGEIVTFEDWMKSETALGYVLNGQAMLTLQSGENVVRVCTEYRPHGNETHRNNSAAYGAEWLVHDLAIS